MDQDYQYALSLYEELNGVAAPSIAYKNLNGNSSNFLGKTSNRISLVEISSDSESDFEVDEGNNHRSRNAECSRPKAVALLKAKDEEVTTENQQAITIKRDKTSSNDYFMPIINTYVDLNNNSEWAKVNMECDVQQMFDKCKEQYFKIWLKNVNYIVQWDSNDVISDDSNFKIFESHKKILLCKSAMIRPRIQLVSVLLHVLIHIYLCHSSKGVIKINNHDENFRQIMLFLNSTLLTDISTCHKFIHSPEESLYSAQWYQCTGICQSYTPFKGVARSTINPSEACSFWKNHDENCGGQFFKIFQMTRTNSETELEEHSYVRNVHYMFPKPRQALKKSKVHLKTNIQARELFDLTDDVSENATVKNLCDVINLDDSDFLEVPETSTSSSHIKNFTSQKLIAFSKCPFCHVVVGTSRFKSHVDSCRGYQEKVIFSLKRKR